MAVAMGLGLFFYILCWCLGSAYWCTIPNFREHGHRQALAPKLYNPKPLALLPEPKPKKGMAELGEFGERLFGEIPSL